MWDKPDSLIPKETDLKSPDCFNVVCFDVVIITATNLNQVSGTVKRYFKNFSPVSNKNSFFLGESEQVFNSIAKNTKGRTVKNIFYDPTLRESRSEDVNENVNLLNFKAR